MKNKENDIDEGIDFSEKAFKKRFKRVDPPKFVQRMLGTPSLRDCKSRITIYLDADIVDRFKTVAEREGKGYQTLINESLRKIVDDEQKQQEKQELKVDLLHDKEFLSQLKIALFEEEKQLEPVGVA